MPDTRRNLSALQALLADNTAGDISAQDARDVLVSNHPENVSQTAALASEPSASLVTGDLFFPNNAPFIERYSGSAWQPWGPIFPFTKPVDGDFSWLNQGSASVSTTNGGILLTGVADASESIRARVKAVPTAPYVVTIKFNANLYSNSGGGFANAGICLTDGTNASTSKILIYGMYLTGAAFSLVVYSRKYDNSTTFNSNLIDSTEYNYGPSPFNCFRIEDNNTNRILSASADGGFSFITMATEARTTFLTPTHIGFYTNAHGASGAPSMRLLSWEEA